MALTAVKQHAKALTPAKIVPVSRPPDTEERHDMLPVPAPALGNGWIFFAPRPGVEIIKRLLQARFGVFGPIDSSELRHQGLSILP